MIQKIKTIKAAVISMSADSMRMGKNLLLSQYSIARKGQPCSVIL